MKLAHFCLVILACSLPVFVHWSLAEEPAKSAGYRVLAADKGHVAIVSAQGEIEWETPTKADVHDLALLPHGNVLFLYSPAKVIEMNRDKKVVWEYEAKPKSPQV